MSLFSVVNVNAKVDILINMMRLAEGRIKEESTNEDPKPVYWWISRYCS